jgi:site-specific DNA recombinase
VARGAGQGTGDRLTEWVEQRPGRRGRPSSKQRTVPAGLRFALYGRVSTREFQDRASSLGWQREFAGEIIAGHGTITAEYFDVGCSRRRAWSRRPQAAALLKRVAQPKRTRTIDAIVVGEYERAFYADQLLSLAPLLRQHGVQIWLPEADGPVDLADPEHRALVTLLGGQSRREVARARFRVTAAMQAQARDQGRYLGGRPPYGYRLVDAGPHPNAAHARWGRRLHQLTPDPATAPHVRWIFARRLADVSVSQIVRELNEREVPCPSRADRARNRHRTGAAWTLRTVASILANPRYTGRQVWNRQRTEHPSTAQQLAGAVESRRWNATQDWVISAELAHESLISETDYIAAQAVNAAPRPVDNTERLYRLVGLLRCAYCQRRLQSHWVHQRAGYRCRHGRTSSTPQATHRAPTLYLREDLLLHRITTELHPDRALSSPDDVVAHLTTHDLTVICTHDTVELG